MDVCVPNSWGSQRLREFNPNHEPAGSPKGGQFASAKSTAGAQAGDAPGRGRAALSTAARPEANEVVQREAAAYAGRPLNHDYVELDQARAGAIADAYEALPVDDSANPAVREAYDALGRELEAQWTHATSNGMRFEPWMKPGQPYQTSSEMAADVRNNRHLYFYTGGDPHPLLSKTSPVSGVTLNDTFRAVHDYYGHAAGGFGFGARGEENAWRAHSQMFSPIARRAMTTETRGQSSWVNWGRQNYDAKGNFLNIPPSKRPYATQKVALLPERFWS